MSPSQSGSRKTVRGESAASDVVVASDVSAAPAIVFSDLDGTFVRTDKTIPERNLEALDLLASRGIPFVPCSGRAASALPEAIVAHPACRYAITANGASVTDLGSGEVIHGVPLDRGRCLALYGRVADRNVTFDLFADGRIYSERARYEALKGFGLTPHEARFILSTRTPTDLTVPEMLRRVGTLDRVTVFWKDRADRDLVVAAVEQDPALAWTTSSPQNLEINARGASKGAALAWLCGHLGVPVARAVAFGDMDNDVSMLEAAGDGVAVANAREEVRALADHVCASNDEAGVGRYLEALLARG